MPEILVTINNEDGTQFQKSFALPTDLLSLDAIDQAVEDFKNDALPQMEKHVLEKAQSQAIAQEKKKLSHQP